MIEDTSHHLHSTIESAPTGLAFILQKYNYTLHITHYTLHITHYILHISTLQSSFVVEEMQTSASSRKLEESLFTSSSLPETHGNNENQFHYLIIVMYLKPYLVLLGSAQPVTRRNFHT